MVTQAWRLVCGLCGRPTADAEATTCDDCSGGTIVHYDMTHRVIAGSELSGIWRFGDQLPLLPGSRRITLGEGGTPLVQLSRWSQRLGLDRVFAKLEFAGPTGSFKDRGAAVLVSHAVERGARLIVEDSSGNAGAAIAAYAARAGLECNVYAPASAPPAKLRQIRAYGATLIPVAGPRSAVEMAAQQASRMPGVYYAGHNANPFFVEGTKTFGIELLQAFEGRGPDHVVIPVGGGSLFVGAALAFGFGGFAHAIPDTPRPRLHLVQASACMPLVAAYAAGADRPLSVRRKATMAGGIEIEAPARGALILRLLRESGGSAVAVEEEEILAAQRDLASVEGIFMEPTSAAAFAGLALLAASGRVRSTETAVVAVTGSGLKDSQPVDG